ncbi:methyltransferase domain-containing protein [Thermoascus aurantiacus ATCC 26904]
MMPKTPLPLSEEWKDPDSYIDSLLSFATSSELFRNLCGGVHILDFLTREPDLYTSLLPEDWRAFFDKHDIQDILFLLLREDIKPLRDRVSALKDQATNGATQDENKWRGGPLPPISLLDYILDIRRFSLRREFTPPSPKNAEIPRHIAVGMNPKKYHEVQNFSRYVADLSTNVERTRGKPISHIVDFGSGQNYLGRTLASPPYNKHIIAIERKHDYVSGAKDLDIQAKFAERKKKIVIRNKKSKKEKQVPQEKPSGCPDCRQDESYMKEDLGESGSSDTVNGQDESVTVINVFRELDLGADDFSWIGNKVPKKVADDEELKPKGTISYIEHEIQDGYLEPIIKHVVRPEAIDLEKTEDGTVVAIDTDDRKASDASVMVVSLHSCGNLVHHGVRSLVLNPSVAAVAMIGCCYNLVTERLGPATWKLPVLRSLHPRLSQTATAYDPHGFPMSKRLEEYPHESGTGIKFNITARTMAVQAPYNWGADDSEGFFIRHFYRALLQRILVDRGVVPKPTIPANIYEMPESSDSGGTALIVGSLRKAAFASFPAYVRAAVAKLVRDPTYGAKIEEKLTGLSDEELERYLKDYSPAKKNLSIAWSLMAFSACVVEAIIVVDRWQFLREHDVVKECWVEPVFDYSESPRNLVVVGIKQ